MWISGDTLMRRSPGGAIAPVKDAPRGGYRSIDLGRDGAGKLVLTYLRCSSANVCKAYSDDLAGTRSAYKRLVPKDCKLGAAPARWGNRVAYGLECTELGGEPDSVDAKRSGLFVRTGSGPAKRLRVPRSINIFGGYLVPWVDLRRATVAAVVNDGFSYGVRQTDRRSNPLFTTLATSGESSTQRVRGFSLGDGGALWTLVNASEQSSPNSARITRISSIDCGIEVLVTRPGPGSSESFRAEAMAVDGRTVYLYAPGIGIVTHDFRPGTCRP